MIKIENVKKTFNKKNVLKNIDINFEPGKVYGFIGNNGAGKTTLLKIIFNELKPDSGQITYLNQPQNKINYHEWMYFVENNELPRGMRAFDYLRYVALMADVNLAEFKKRLQRVCEVVDLNFNLKNKIKNLSAGQKKILSCLSMLINKPKIIFLDEPTANLDPSNKSLVLKIIDNLKKDDRIIVVITHLFDDIQGLVTDVVIVDDGVIKKTKALKANDSIAEVFNQYVFNQYDEKKEQIGEYLNEE